MTQLSRLLSIKYCIITLISKRNHISC